MISLSSSLTAAMQSRQGKPCVRVVVEDKEWRWSTVLETEASGLQTAACEITGGAVLRARVTAAGKVEVQTVTLPNVGSSWQSPWAEVASDAMSGSDVALVRWAGHTRVRLFYVKESGGTYYLRVVESTDDGSNWGSPADVFSTGTVIGSLAAGGTLIYYVRDSQVHRRYKSWVGGSWSAENTWTAAGTLAEDNGLAVAITSGGAPVSYLAVAGKWGDYRRIRTGTFNDGDGEGPTGWSASLADVVPPGIPAADFRPRWPSLALVGTELHLCYLDTFGGTPSYSMPVVVRSSDWDHWGVACALYMGWSTLARANIVYNAVSGTEYVAMEQDVVGADEYDASDSDRKGTYSEVLFYQMDVGAGYGYLLVDLHNPGHKYDNFGQAGEDGAPIKLLSTVTMERGYRTCAGSEYVASSPFYVVGVSHRVGVGRPALRLMCVDGWGLIGCWEVDQSYTWSGKSISWLIAEIVARSSSL